MYVLLVEDHVRFKGNRSGVTSILWKLLKKRGLQCDLISITIDEHSTFEFCNNCREKKEL
ncbi:hypothetical protein BDF21DRAFT_433751 [Thamnidium elegans]|nr:hypothetical protein BDF21DRAFT_433751 [Thamnidium elegans]